MKFTLSWLKDHLETKASLDEILHALTDLGLEVEEVENPEETLGAFRICRVIEAVQHPNADRLRVCRVETWPDGPGGRTEEVQVVCGAPNAKTGLVGVFAPPGTHVPGTGVDLKPGNIRDEIASRKAKDRPASIPKPLPTVTASSSPVSVGLAASAR